MFRVQHPSRALIPLEELKTLRIEGWSIGRLARHFGTSTPAIYTKLQRHAPELSRRIKGVVGNCEICDTYAHLCADHDHANNRARGLLCRGCNQGLGNFTDSIERLEHAVVYLHRHRQPKAVTAARDHGEGPYAECGPVAV